MALAASYPVQVDFQGDRAIHRWRPLVQWLFAIPQLIVSSALRAVRQALTLIAFFTVLFTKDIPRSLAEMIAMSYRYEWRTLSYAAFMRESYPPFEFSPVAADPGGDPATLSIEYPANLKRWLPLVKWFLAIPHYVVAAALAIASVVVVVIAFFAVIFTGEYPAGLRDFLVASFRYVIRVEAYVGFLTDRYPPFSLRL